MNKLRQLELVNPSIDWMGPSTGRGLGNIALCHGYSKESFAALLTGQNILDIGSGLSGLASQVRDLGIGAHVISIDAPKALFKEPVKGYRTGGEVIARAQSLPFADESFDIVLSTFSQPMYAETVDEQKELVSEGLRVIKSDGGIMSLSPGVSWGDLYLRTTQEVEDYYVALTRDMIELPEHIIRVCSDDVDYLPLGCVYATDRIVLQRVISQ